MAGRPIVIHVPKTGGTTLIMAITGGQAPPVPGETYRHIYFSDDRTVVHSNCGDIFAPQLPDDLAQRTFVLTLRNPLDRLESEFNFLSNRSEFREIWNRQTGVKFPTRMIDFVSHEAVDNSVCAFLLGRDLYEDGAVSTSDVDGIIRRLDELDMAYGLTHEMAATIRNVSHRCSMEFDDILRRHRTSVYKADRGEDWGAVESVFAERNASDLSLYEAVSERFESQVRALPEDTDCRFVGGAYDSLMRYCASAERRPPVEIYVNDVSNPQALLGWIDANRPALRAITEDAMRQAPRNGKAFVGIWLELVSDQLLESGTRFDIDDAEPLETLRRLARHLGG